MKYFTYIFTAFVILACSEAPSIQTDVSSDRNALKDMGTDAIKDTRRDLADVPDLPGIHHFPDPNREGGRLCENSLDCKRFEYCTSFGDCSFGKGCGFGGEPVPFGGEDIGCIIDENGIGELTGAECKSDDVCPSEMPYCYLRACQKQPRCTVKSDCEETQICDNDKWCATLPPCETDDDCLRGNCGDNNICDYDA